jgi:hypothetical protein
MCPGMTPDVQAGFLCPLIFLFFSSSLSPLTSSFKTKDGRYTLLSPSGHMLFKKKKHKKNTAPEGLAFHLGKHGCSEK